MQELYGQCRDAVVMLHGGAGPQDPKSGGVKEATADLGGIAAHAIGLLEGGMDAIDVVVECLKAMELNERFNAGRGSALQRDGQARLTAALMDSQSGRFSGVIASSYVAHPSVMARHLQNHDSRVLTAPGTDLLSRELGLPVESNLTSARLRKWSEKALQGCDTVGALVRGADGRLAAGTSTGGRGYEYPGRVSDSGTVAGNYCTRYAAVSATGVGEEIVDDAVAARIETRVRDGMALQEASHKCFAEAIEFKRSYGWIGLDSHGGWAAAHVTPTMSFVVYEAGKGKVASS